MRWTRSVLFVCLLMLLVTASAYAVSGIEVIGDLTLSGAGGIVFPDGSTQTTAAAPTWHQTLTANRFVSVMGGAAQLDNETGLVWATSPDSTVKPWDEAVNYCYSLNSGGRGGWRLPTITELRSLVDPTQGNPALPANHPFVNVQSAYYWSSTTYVPNTAYVWIIGMSGGDVSYGNKSVGYYVWPVRGGQ